jgi:hypothetical protein
MSKLLERLKRHNAAHDWLEAQGFEPVSAYGKYVLITVDGELKDYKDFTEAAEVQG